MTVINMRKILAMILFIHFVLIGAVLATTSVSIADKDSSDIIAFLSQELKLDEQQTKQLGASLEKFATKVDKLMEDQEAEDAEPDALIKGVKQAQDEYNKELEKILSKDQLKQYNAQKEKAIKGMFSDLVEIKLLDIQPKTSISDEQISQLAPLLGGNMYKIIQIAWENAGKSLRAPQKIRLARDLKRIQSDSRAALEKILTPEQVQAWDKYKEEQKKK